jgi:helicase
LTYERFAALALTMPHILRQVSVTIVDEVQMITDRNRGANLEFLLTLLKSQRQFGIEPQILALSAVIGDTNGFESWLGGRLLKTTKRPVPLDEGLIDRSGTYRYVDSKGDEHSITNYIAPAFRKGSSQDIIIPLVSKLVADGEEVIVFRETKPIVRATAEYLKDNLALPPAKETIALLPAGDPSAATEQLRGCLAGGIAFHNADLGREERLAIESTFRDASSSLKVLVATTTLAMGVNTPAWSVVIAGLNHPDGPYTVAEYKNMIGRAGRLRFTPKGKSFLVASNATEEQNLWHRYVLGEPEDLYSRFVGQEPMSLICRVLATAKAARSEGLNSSDLLAFIQSTFTSHQKHQSPGAGGNHVFNRAPPRRGIN